MPNRPGPTYCYCPERFVKVDRKVMKKFAEKIVELLADSPDGIEMPGLFGVLNLTRFNKEVADYKKSKEHGRAVYYTNFHSEQQVATANISHRWRHNRVLRKGYPNGDFLYFKPYRPLREMIKRGVEDGSMFDWRYIPKKVKYEDINNSRKNKGTS